MLTFIRDTRPRKALYKCDCGNEAEAFKNNVSSGHTSSCGCLRQQVTSKRSKTHGHKSGGVRSRTYVAWVNMKTRCNNANRKDAKNYMGRGIGYCEEWELFENFLHDMGEVGPSLSLDRIDNSLGYSKENCRWATMQVQNLNKRNHVRHEFNGENLTLSEWSRKTSIGRVTILKRLQRGVPIELALTVKGYLEMSKHEGKA